MYILDNLPEANTKIIIAQIWDKLIQIKFLNKSNFQLKNSKINIKQAKTIIPIYAKAVL
ncbi:MAG: hypothetical protein LBC61_02740 [Candidatus Peribacteria bacterium]|nr:hypothetical protein [Candidatus Peribacteria bacterium]